MNLLFRFNSDGTLKEFTGGNLIQSSVKSDTLYVKVDDVDVSNFVAMAEYKRPDGKVSNDIAMTYEEIPYGLGYGFRQTIPAWCTQLDGQLEITIRLLTFTSNGDKRVFAMTKNVVKVLASTSAGDGEVNITDEQYDALLETLANKSLNEVVGKDVEEYLNQKFEEKSGLIDEYLEEQTSRIENEIDTELKEMDDTIKGLGDLKPSGTAPSSSIISFKDNVGIYIGEDDGNWYYWKASEQRYVVGGVYQNDINTIDLGVVIYSSPLGSGKEYKVGVLRLIQRIEAYIEENNIGTRNLIFICKMQNDGQNIGIWTSFYNGENKEIYVNIYRDEENLIYHSYIDDDTGNRKNEEVIQKNIEIPDESVTLNKLEKNIQEPFIENFYSNKTTDIISNGIWDNDGVFFKELYVPINIKVDNLVLTKFSFTQKTKGETNATIYLLKDSQVIKSKDLILINGNTTIEFEVNKSLMAGEYQLKIVAENEVLHWPYNNNHYNDDYISTSGTNYVWDNSDISYKGTIEYKVYDNTLINLTNRFLNNIEYENVGETNKSIVNLSDFIKWGDINNNNYDLEYKENSITFPIPQNGNSGIDSGVLSLNGSDIVYFEFEIDLGTYTDKLSAYLQVINNEGNSEYLILKSITENGKYSLSFDPAYYNVYYNAVSFKILFVGNDNTSGIQHSITISNFKCYQSDIKGLNIYDKTLKGIIKKIQYNLDNISLNINNEENYLVAPNGSKYIMQVNNNGLLSAVNIIPNKALFIGNSLLMGFSTFGMAASDNQHDYYYIVNQEIRTQNNNYSASKLFGGNYEACTTETSQNEWITNTLTPALSNDLDLVIVQLGDNVNTEEKLAVFENGAIKLLQAIRNTCPNARVVWVGEWYSSSTKQQYIYNACSKTGSLFVDISDLSTSENQAKIGDVITYPDGTTTTITESGVASHPSNVGMEKIAKRILFKLGLIDSK